MYSLLPSAESLYNKVVLSSYQDASQTSIQASLQLTWDGENVREGGHPFVCENADLHILGNTDVDSAPSCAANCERETGPICIVLSFRKRLLKNHCR